MCIEDILEEFGTDAFSSMLLAVSLLLVSPLSDVPFFSSACGIAIFLIAIQGAFGRRSIWLPASLVFVSITSGLTERAIGRALSS